MDLVLSMITAFATNLIVEGRRSKAARYKLIEMIRSVNKEIDDFYVSLQMYEKSAFFPVILAFFLSYFIIITRVFAVYVVFLNFVLTTVTFHLLLNSKDPHSFIPPVNHEWHTSFYYGIRKYYFPLLILIFANLFLAAFFSVFESGLFLGPTLSIVRIPPSQLLNVSLTVGILTTVLGGATWVLLEGVTPIRVGHHLYWKGFVSVGKIEHETVKKKWKVTVRELKGIVKEVSKLEDIEDLVFRLTGPTVSTICFKFGPESLNGATIKGVGRALLLEQNGAIISSGWETITAVSSIVREGLSEYESDLISERH